MKNNFFYESWLSIEPIFEIRPLSVDHKQTNQLDVPKEYRLDALQNFYLFFYDVITTIIYKTNHT